MSNEEKKEQPIVLGVDDLIFEEDQQPSIPSNKPSTPIQSQTHFQPLDTDPTLEDTLVFEDPVTDPDAIELQEETEEEESKEWSLFAKVCVGLGLFALFCGGIFAFLTYQQNQIRDLVKWKEDVLEYGEPIDSPIRSIKNGYLLLHCDDVDTLSVGQQEIVARIADKDGKEKTVTHMFTIKDTKKPTIEMDGDQLITTQYNEPDFSSLNIRATDPVDGDVSVSFDQGNYSKLGKTKAIVIAEDFNGNQTKKKITVRVIGTITQEGLATYRSQVAQAEAIYQQQQEEKARLEKEKEEMEVLKKKYTGYDEQVLSLEKEVRSLCKETWDVSFTELVMAILQTRYQAGQSVNAQETIYTLHPLMQKAGATSMYDSSDIQTALFWYAEPSCQSKEGAELQKCIVENDRSHMTDHASFPSTVYRYLRN